MASGSGTPVTAGKEMFIFSCIVTVGLLIAWIVTTSVSAASRNRKFSSRSERDGIIRSISGEKGVRRAHLQDAVDNGDISASDASKIEQMM